ncbi:catechol 1,2-dioxygenase [Salmonella enterica subsp. enterica serovar Choleraesuis]|nr:catechol 1,2-dioxygenase [Salmonella enterica subsp. enterica serovar Choleraesuis]
MSVKILNTEEVQQLINISSGFTVEGGNPRFKKIMQQLITSLCAVIEENDVTDEEFWDAVNYLHFLGGRQEAALLAAGLGLEHFLDLRADAKAAAAGDNGGTPRTIEGPLYVAGAPLSDKHARMDDGKDNGEVMWLHGQVLDTDGQPVANAIVDIWHANTLGNYSFFDKSQSEFNLRRRVKTGPDGRYSARSIVPSGYGCPPDGATQALLNQLGRHGNRPAHIHFFVSAPGYKHLTTQINLDGDEYLWDDFAFATRDGLIAAPVKVTDSQLAAERDIDGPHTEVRFDFALAPTQREQEEQRIKRLRALES